MGKIDIEINGSLIIIDTTNLSAEQIANIKEILNYQEEVNNPDAPILDENEEIIGYEQMPNDKPWLLEWAKDVFSMFIVKLEVKAQEKAKTNSEVDIKAIKDII